MARAMHTASEGQVTLDAPILACCEVHVVGGMIDHLLSTIQSNLLDAQKHQLESSTPGLFVAHSVGVASTHPPVLFLLSSQLLPPGEKYVLNTTLRI